MLISRMDDRSYDDYWKIIMNYMRGMGEISLKNFKFFYGFQVVQELLYSGERHGVKVLLDKNLNLTMILLSNIKNKISDEGVSVIDTGFYVRYILQICEGIEIRELRTYFKDF